jgi:LacI family gluconate utilization system Gnt-I transcriptional repressor
MKQVPVKVRLTEVAKLAQVSPMTVSRALNAPELLKPDTLNKELKTIEQLGYVPDMNATSLVSQKSHIIGAIVPTMNNAIFAQTVLGLQRRLDDQGYQLLLGQSQYQAAQEDSLVRTFLGRRVDGIVLTGAQHSTQTRQRLQAAGIPVVETWDLPSRPIDMVAGFSNLKAGQAMANYLIGKGHRVLGFVGGGDGRTQMRYRGFQAAAQKAGVQLHPIWVPSGVQMDHGRRALSQLLDEGKPVSAVFFSNDAYALSALMECRRRGLRVPQDIAIAGFADLELAAELEPALTTVKVHATRIGEVAADMLVARLRGETLDSTRVDLGFEVMVRASA